MITLLPMVFSLLPIILLWSSVRGVPVLETSNVAPRNNDLDVTPEQCNRFSDWIEDGILEEDCEAAINELYHDAVVPRGGQEYEFLRKYVRKESDLPYVMTPQKHWYRKWSHSPPSEFRLTHGRAKVPV